MLEFQNKNKTKTKQKIIRQANHHCDNSYRLDVDSRNVVTFPVLSLQHYRSNCAPLVNKRHLLARLCKWDCNLNHIRRIDIAVDEKITISELNFEMAHTSELYLTDGRGGRREHEGGDHLS